MSVEQGFSTGGEGEVAVFTRCHLRRVPARKGPFGDLRVLVVLVVVLSGGPGWAGTTTQPAAAAGHGLEAQPSPAYASTSRVPETLLGRSRRPVLILPSEPGEPGEDRMQRSSGAIAKLPAEPHRLPEGYIVAGREARAERSQDRYVLHLAKAQGLPDAPPLRVLPNRGLAMLEAILAATGGPRTFMVTGRVTEFQGANSILLENLVEVLPEPPVQRADETTESAPEKAAARAGTGDSATRPAEAREPTAEEVMERLMGHRTLRAVVLPQHQPVAHATAPAPGEDDAGPNQPRGREGPGWAEGTLLVDRSGRVVPGDSWWMFVFEDRGQHSRHRPIRLLPNRLLETAISLSRGGTHGVVFTVSGDVTLHRGANYLLLHKVLVRHDLGNFR